MLLRVLRELEIQAPRGMLWDRSTGGWAAEGRRPKCCRTLGVRFCDPLATPLTCQETGVGKTVNSLRKHEQVGGFARDLVAQWKKLVPVER